MINGDLVVDNSAGGGEASAGIEMTGMEQEYQEALHGFYQTYRPLQQKYNLRMHSHFSIYGGGIIEIWEYESYKKGRCICEIKEDDEIACYKKAMEMLENYRQTRDKSEAEANEKKAG